MVWKYFYKDDIHPEIQVPPPPSYYTIRCHGAIYKLHVFLLLKHFESPEIALKDTVPYRRENIMIWIIDDQIIEGVQICLETTHVLNNGRFYRQLHISKLRYGGYCNPWPWEAVVWARSTKTIWERVEKPSLNKHGGLRIQHSLHIDTWPVNNSNQYHQLNFISAFGLKKSNEIGWKFAEVGKLYLVFEL